jgi:hypothetical protein
MTVTLSNVHLNTDTGSSSSDKISSQAAISGTATGNPPPFGSAQVQFDHNNDGTADGWATISGGNFSYDPLATDSALNNWEGALTIRYRTRELDAYGGEVSVGDWQNFNMTLDRVKPTASTPALVEVTENSANTQVNLHNIFSDGVTPDNQLLYQIVGNTNPGLFDSVSISGGALTLDYKEDTCGDAHITIRATDAAGNIRDIVQSVCVSPLAIPPTIVTFDATLISGNTYRFSGTVTDDDPMVGQTVYIFVDPDIFFTAIVQADNSFSVDKELPGGTFTYSFAATIDIEDYASDFAWILL